MLDQMFNRKALNLELLPSVSKIRALYSEDPYSVVYLDNMLEGYEKKIEMLDAFQRRLSINPRSGIYYAKVVTEDMKHGNADESRTAGDILDKIET